MKLIDENGKIQKDEVKSLFMKMLKDDSKAEEATNKCAVDKDTTEETSRHLFKCSTEYMDTHHT